MISQPTTTINTLPTIPSSEANYRAATCKTPNTLKSCVICYEPISGSRKNLIYTFNCTHSCLHHQECLEMWANALSSSSSTTNTSSSGTDNTTGPSVNSCTICRAPLSHANVIQLENGNNIAQTKEGEVRRRSIPYKTIFAAYIILIFLAVVIAAYVLCNQNRREDDTTASPD